MAEISGETCKLNIRMFVDGGKMAVSVFDHLIFAFVITRP